jgi:hypothetical protein
MRASVVALLLALFVTLIPAGAVAQFAPDAPRLVSPQASGGFGVHLVTVPTEPGTDRAVVFTWAPRALPTGLRVRGGAGNGVGEEAAVAIGLDLQAPIYRSQGALPFLLDWQGGIGLSHGEYGLVSLPMGLSGGVSWQSGSVWAAPYATAGLVADLRSGRNAPEEEFRMRGTADIGIDVSFDADRNLVLRAAHAVAGRRTSSVGLAFYLGRLQR